MPDKRTTLIDGLIDDLVPVKRVSRPLGLAMTGLGIGLTMAVVISVFGLRDDLLLGTVVPTFILPAGIFFLLGLVCTLATIAMATPYVGARNEGWLWAGIVAGILPISALVIAAAEGLPTDMDTALREGVNCAIKASGLGVIVASLLTIWLRRGTPASPDRAGLVTGLAGASFGVFAWSTHCPISDLFHVGIWHGVVPIIGAIAGRIIIAPLVRW